MRQARIWDWTQYKDAHERYEYDLSAEVTRIGTTVSSGTAASDGDVTLTIDSPNTTTSAGVWTGRITSDKTGNGQIKITFTLANGDTKIRYFNVAIVEPDL